MYIMDLYIVSGDNHRFAARHERQYY